MTDLVLADPDRSNPTRSRWERPLDTIRSFEAAIDGGHNRKSFIRTGTGCLTTSTGCQEQEANLTSAQNPTLSPIGTVGVAITAVSRTVCASRSLGPLTDIIARQPRPLSPGPPRRRRPPRGQSCATELCLHALCVRPETRHTRPRSRQLLRPTFTGTAGPKLPEYAAWERLQQRPPERPATIL